MEGTDEKKRLETADNGTFIISPKKSMTSRQDGIDAYGVFSSGNSSLESKIDVLEALPDETPEPVAVLEPDAPEPVAVLEPDDAPEPVAVFEPGVPEPDAPKDKDSPRVSFSIGVKLVIMMTVVLFFSLGLISAMVWFLVHTDTRNTAGENNRSINDNAASAAEAILDSVRANGILLSRALAGGDRGDTSFFSDNRSIAVFIPDGRKRNSGSFPGTPPVLVNEDFFASHELDASLAGNYAAGVLPGLDGGPELLNAAPFFNGVPMLCLRFSYDDYQGAVLFSPETLLDSYGTGANTSFMINDSGDVLIHPDRELIRNTVNLGGDPLIRGLLENKVKQTRTMYRNKDGQGFFASAERIAGGGAFVITTIASDIVFEGINTTTRRNLYLSLGTWFLGVLFIWFFSRSITGTLDILREAAEAIEDGHYHLELEAKNHDETGLLTESMISMSHVLLNFEKFTNKTIAILARKGRLEIGGTDRNATIFFSDIRSFTAISEKLRPAEVVEFLNDYMDRMVACILVTGGIIDKFIGDAVMAHWGAVETPEQDYPPGRGLEEQHALNGIRAALLMRAALRSFNDGRGGEKRPALRMGCALNSGHVVAGQIGSEEKLEYTVIGDTVSLADRTESLNKRFGTEILITEHTWRLTGKYLLTSEMPPVSDKGQKLRVFAVINMKDPEENARLIEDSKKIPKMNSALALSCIGPQGPESLEELRSLLGIPVPGTVRGNLVEKKYRLSEGKDGKGGEGRGT
ncbi:MAG: adenylate/guanylate cyclase domain-containing protein [Spirochaetaceae bacterium]|jgi:adenylate cyclase|nr:adenylate/guanylate cyclase domain-containing protein [Spirochaetaceae bacterium]